MSRIKTNRLTHEQRMNGGEQFARRPVMTLEEYCDGFETQLNASEALGISQPSLSNNLKSSTEFIVVDFADGPRVYPGRTRTK